MRELPRVMNPHNTHVKQSPSLVPNVLLGGGSGGQGVADAASYSPAQSSESCHAPIVLRQNRSNVLRLLYETFWVALLVSFERSLSLLSSFGMLKAASHGQVQPLLADGRSSSRDKRKLV